MRTKLRGKVTLLFLAFAVALAFPAMALADVVIVNDVNVGAGNASKAAGATGTANIWLEPENNLPKGDYNGCNVGIAGDNVKATVTLQSSDINKVYFGPDNARSATTTTQLDTCDTDPAAGLQTPTADNEVAYKVASNAPSGSTATISVTNVTGGLSSGTQTSQYVTTDTLIVNITAPPDSTSPVITKNVTGTQGSNGWYTSNVGVDWTVSDPESAISSQSGCADFNVTSDQNATNYTCAATSAGGANSDSVSIKRDATPPTNIQFVGGPNAGGSYAFGSVPDAPTCTADDATSTLDSCVVTGYSNAVGGQTLTATATDKAGNKSTATRTYTVDKAATTTTVTCDAGPFTYDGSAHEPCSASVSGPGLSNQSVPVSYTNNTNAGTATASASYAGSDNYLGSQGSKTFTIDKANAVIDVNGYTGTYDGQAHGATGTAEGVGGADLSNLLNLGASFTNVPGGTANWSFAGNDNHKAASGSVSISIAKAATTTTVTCTGGPFTYTGSAITPCSASVSGPGLSNQALTVDYTNNTNAGTATASASYAGTGNYAASTDSKDFTIAKANQTINFGALAGKTFGDANFNVNATGGNSGNAVTFKADGNCSVSGNTVQITGAGSCTITASQAGNANYNAATDVSRSFAIAKAQASLSLGGLSKTYNGSPQGATVNTTPVDLSGVNVTYDGSAAVPENAGRYAVVASLSNPNYRATDVTGTLVIDKAQAQVNLSNLSQTYDGMVKAASASTTPTGLNVDLAYSQNGSAATPRNAGSYAVVATVNNANYQGSAEGTLSIARADQAISFGALANKTYGDANFDVSATGGNSGEAVTFTARGNCKLVGNTVHLTGAGSCTITASQAGNANYNAATPVERSFAIAKAQASINLSDLSKTYTGQAQGATVTTTPDVPNAQLTVTYDGSETRPTNAGSYAVVASLNDANYEARDATGTLVIAKAPAQVSLSGLSKTYTGQAQGATVTTTPADLGGVSVTYDGNAQAPTNAGSYAVVATVNNANYEGSAEGTLSIAKATPQVSITWANSTYDATANAASATVSGVGNANLGAADSLTYYAGTTASGTPLSGAPKDAGTYTVKATFGGTANYTQASATQTITIAKANPVVTWSNPAAIDYGTALSSTQLNAQANVAGSFTYTPAAGAVLKAGTQTLKADFTPADTGNYNLASKTVSLVVNPYSFTGFFQPIDNNGTLNSVKAGSTVPVKFSLGGDKGMDILAQTPSTGKILCDPNATVDAVEEVLTTTNSGLKYDPVANQYIYNWKTATSYASTCQQLIVRLADGTTVKSANFKFTK